MASNFWGKEIVFNGIPSSRYNLRIVDFDMSAPNGGDAGGKATIHQDWVYRNPKSLYYGISQNTPLEFEVTIANFDTLGISSVDKDVIYQQYLGRQTYLPFQILQCDMENVIFNVIFTSATTQYVGRLAKGITLHGVCNAPWGYEKAKTLTKSYSGSSITLETFNFYNGSADSYYNKPIISFTLNGVGDSFSLTNTTDDSNIFTFSNLSAYETITVDNYKQSIVSSTGLKRISNFNLNWFYLVPKTNSLTINGAISNFSMTYSFAKKVGV